MNKQQLASRIWMSANKMRSKIEANEYKDYILGFIFYKFLSDREEQFARSQGFDEKTLEEEFYETNTEAVSLVQTHLGYFISYKHLFSTWLKDGTDFNVADVRDALSAFTRLIAKSHTKVFEKIFNTLETGLSKLGDTAANQTKAIKSLLALIKDIPMDGRQDYDVLGFVYEYLIGMFAANAGKKAGEFYTPHEVALFMAEIVADHLKDREAIQIYDPTSGSGSLLINIGRAMSRHLADPDKIKYYAQELKENTYNLTRMNLVMRGILPANIEVRNGDTLERDWPYFDEANPDESYEPLFVDAVVSNPPYSQHWFPAGRESDPRYVGFGLAPKSKADYAFLLHDLYHLKPDGIMTIVLPHGVLFRGKKDDGSEWSIRRALVEGNHIDAIIGLPPNIFFGTGIPTIVMVLRKHRENNDVLIVEASRGFIKDGKKNRLRSSDVKRIADAVIAHAEMPGFSRRVSRDEIRANDYNLNIPRYLSHNETEHWDVKSIMFGGIPEVELDELNEYWSVFTTLRKTLAGANLRAARDAISDLVARDKSVAAFRTRVADALAGFDEYLQRELIGGLKSVKVNTEENKIAAEIFRRVDDLPLIDNYEAYQLLDDQWLGIANDLETLQEEGMEAVRKVDPNMVLKKKDDKEVEVQDGWVGRILPFELVQRELFAAELGEIAAKEAEAERLASDIAGIAAEIPEDDRESVAVEDGEELDAKKVAEKVVEIATDGMTPDRNGKFPKKAVERRLAELRTSDESDADSFEALVLRAYDGFQQIKELRSEVRKLENELQEKTIKAINEISDERALELLEKKWIRPVVAKLNALPEAILDTLVAKLKALTEKYAVTYAEVAKNIADSESALAGFIDELTGSPDDLAGLAAWKKEMS